MNDEKSIRAFLAIEPPAEIRQEIGDIQNSLKRRCPFDVRWVKPDGIHLTLKFFGSVSEEDIMAISRVVEENTAVASPLHLKVNKVGLFPSRRRPRVLWIGLGGDTPPLLVMQENLEQGFAGHGFAKEERPFRPHLTIGRVKTPHTSGDPEQFMANADDWAAGSFIAPGLGLFKSDLTPQGAVHTRLAWFPFGLSRDRFQISAVKM